MKLSKAVFVIIGAIWIIIWLNFLGRDLFKKGGLKDYARLLKMNTEERRAFAYGDTLYGLLRLVKKSIPNGSAYRFVDNEEYSISYRRAVYYLYPLLQSDKADYIVVYGRPDYKEKGYAFFAGFDKDNFILKKM